MTSAATANTIRFVAPRPWLSLALATWILGCGRSGLDLDQPSAVDAGALVDVASVEASGRPDGGTTEDAPSPPGCGPCDGCCDGTTCIARTQQSASACGWGGGECRACAPGDECVKGGTCLHAQSSCGPSNCAGCCVGPAFCSDGLSGLGGCGFGGQLCQVCSDGARCAPRSGGGACGGAQRCDAVSCPFGCCQGDVCVVGVSDQACGTQGHACTACPQGQTCVESGSGGGICQSPPFCKPIDCSPNGCCQGNQCMPGTSDSACGEGGTACVDCAATGHVCVAGHCASG